MRKLSETWWFRYLQERHQFKVPLASFQLCQEKLMRMLGNIQAMSLMSWRITNMFDAGKMSLGQASLGKVSTTSSNNKNITLVKTFNSSGAFHAQKPMKINVIYKY